MFFFYYIAQSHIQNISVIAFRRKYPELFGIYKSNTSIRLVEVFYRLQLRNGWKTQKFKASFRFSEPAQAICVAIYSQRISE